MVDDDVRGAKDVPTTLIPCRWCGQEHALPCPLVKAVELDANGVVTRIEFWSRIELDAMMIEHTPKPYYR